MRRSFLYFLILATVALDAVNPSRAQDFIAEPAADEPAAAYAGPLFPNIELPAHVPAPPGELTLYADFAARDEHGIPLYVVNRTWETVRFDGRGEGIYPLLEHRLPDGRWERAETLDFGFCGNAYSEIELAPGQHLKYHGYAPAGGEKARVRFVNHGIRYPSPALVSNEGDGLVLAADIRAAKVDGLARFLPRALADALETHSLPAQAGTPADPASCVAALRLLQTYENNAWYKAEAEKSAKTWAGKRHATPAETQAARVVRKLLAGPWPAERNPDALLRRCRQALGSSGSSAANGGSSDTGDEAFGLPENARAMVWEMMRSLVETQFRQPPGSLASWQPVIALLPEAFASGDPKIVSAAAGIAYNARLADELIPNDFFEGHLGNANVRIYPVCAAALARRGQRARMVEIAWKLPPANQAAVLQALAFPKGGSARVEDDFATSPKDERERLFWEHCMRQSPVESVEALYPFGEFDQGIAPHAFPGIIYTALREYLVKEAERSEAAPADFEARANNYRSDHSAELLAGWNKDEDTALLQRLLHYRGYVVEQSKQTDPADPNKMKDRTQWSYLYRWDAKRMLRKRGVPLTDEVVGSVDVTPP